MLRGIMTRALSFALAVAAHSPSLAAQEASEGRKLYVTYCSGCHGISGKGDGPAAKTLAPKPADHTIAAMKNYSDQYLASIISKGGASVGKSPLMPAWGSVLKESQIAAIVDHIRGLSPGQKDTAKPDNTKK